MGALVKIRRRNDRVDSFVGSAGGKGGNYVVRCSRESQRDRDFPRKDQTDGLVEALNYGRQNERPLPLVSL